MLIDSKVWQDFQELAIFAKTVFEPSVGIIKPDIQRSKSDHEDRRQLLDDLAFLCDTEPRSKTVSAIAFEETSRGLRVSLASNKEVALHVKGPGHLQRVLENLQKLPYPLDPREANKIDDQILRDSVKLSIRRLTTFGDTFKKHFQTYGERLEQLGMLR